MAVDRGNPKLTDVDVAPNVDGSEDAIPGSDMETSDHVAGPIPFPTTRRRPDECAHRCQEPVTITPSGVWRENAVPRKGLSMVSYSFYSGKSMLLEVILHLHLRNLAGYPTIFLFKATGPLAPNYAFATRRT